MIVFIKKDYVIYFIKPHCSDGDRYSAVLFHINVNVIHITEPNIFNFIYRPQTLAIKRQEDLFVWCYLLVWSESIDDSRYERSLEIVNK